MIDMLQTPPLAAPSQPPATPAPTPPTDQGQASAIDAAVAAHMKRSMAGMPAMLTELFAAHVAATGAKPAPSTAAPASAGDDLASLRAQLKGMQDQAAGDRKTAREAASFQALRTELGGKVRPEALDHAAKLLFHADRRVLTGEDGAVVFKHGDADYSLREGVAAYLRSPDAAWLLPAPTGGQRGPTGRPLPPRPPGAPPLVETPMAKTLRILAGLKAGL